MTLETWIAFAIASQILLIVPGPTVMLIVGYGLTQGARAALMAVLGGCLGTASAFVVAFGGLGAVLAASATAFTAIKWLGAVYLIYLGLQMWRIKTERSEVSQETELPSRLRATGLSPALWHLFWRGYISTLLNPKIVVFLVAFTPQFIDPTRPTLPQAVIMTVTFVTLAFISDGAMGIFASRVRILFVGEGRGRKWLHRIGGSFLIGAGIFTAFARRSDT